MSIIPEQFWKEIRLFPEKIILVSGGVDSTYIALEFHKRGIETSLLFNETGLSLSSSRKTLVDLFKKTNYPFLITYAEDTKEVLKDSFRALDGIDKKYYNKKEFICCYYLKHKPTEKLLKGSMALTISGIAPYEGKQRRIFLSQLRKKNTFLHFHKTKNRFYAYPLRDQFKEISLLGVSHSGCEICPILLLFRMIKEEPQRYAKSKRYYIKAIGGKFCNKLDHTLDEYPLKEVD